MTRALTLAGGAAGVTIFGGFGSNAVHCTVSGECKNLGEQLIPGRKGYKQVTFSTRKPHVGTSSSLEGLELTRLDQSNIQQVLAVITSKDGEISYTSFE